MDSTTDKLTSQLKASERALQLCYLIEALPASIQQTEISILASEVRTSLNTLAAECLRLREVGQAICKAVTMGSDGRLEISDEESFVAALAQAQALDSAKEGK